MIRVELAKNISAAQELADQLPRVVAVETEYGEHSLNTSHPNVEVALNHHGKDQNKIVPALSYKLFNGVPYDNFIVSHIDLDVLFGIMWASGLLKETATTIQLAELTAKSDLYGFHIVQDMLPQYPKHIQQKYLLIGYLVNSWVINDDGHNQKDISKEVHKLMLKIKDIIINNVDEQCLESVNEWLEQQERIAKHHLREIVELCNDELMFVFQASFSLTTAYKIGDEKASIIVHYNEQSKSISLSCYDEATAQRYFGKDGVIEPLQKFFGPNAGGKNVIGGSPRDLNLQPEIIQSFVEFLKREYFNIPMVRAI